MKYHTSFLPNYVRCCKICRLLQNLSSAAVVIGALRFNVTNMSFVAFCENKRLIKVFDFTVQSSHGQIAQLVTCLAADPVVARLF